MTDNFIELGVSLSGNAYNGAFVENKQEKRASKLRKMCTMAAAFGC
jgi:hypothetical protein